ncbi:MAG: flagellar basal body P-ring formation protein FlgA [Candidatus Poribacteria bacterium]|nr:flagellar basal body P-ring formation protein FlgA [Candidatus Poribacteria bacterium]
MLKTRKALFWCVILIFFMPLIGFAVEEKISISMLENSSVNSKEIYLSDIARINSPEQTMNDKLQKVFICRSAEPGSSVNLNISYIKSRAKQQGITPESIVWNGSDHVTIETKSISLSMQEIQSSAEAFISGLVGKSTAKVSIKPANDIKPIVLPDGKVDIRTELVSPYAVNDNTLLRFILSVDGRDYGKQIIPFKVDIIKDVIITAKDIDLHKILIADDLVIVSQNVGLSTNAFYTKDELIGKRVKRMLSKGTLVNSDMVENPPIIKQGDLVTIVVESSSLRVTARGKAMENGINGQVIRVINTLSMKEVHAKIVDEKTVKISL